MFEAHDLDRRITQKISLREFASIIFVLGLTLYFTFTHTGSFYDYKNYLATARGDYSNYFYGYWILPLFYFFSFFPFEIGYTLWAFFGVMGVWFAARVFNGKSVFALLSYQMSYSLF